MFVGDSCREGFLHIKVTVEEKASHFQVGYKAHNFYLSCPIDFQYIYAAEPVQQGLLMRGKARVGKRTSL
jgi:hypothetical protein